jgi:tetratricopeptide (TPR) repeat protein
MAREALKKAVTLDSGNAEAYKELASAYMHSDEDINVGHLSEEEYCLAETACRIAISLSPSDAKAFLLLGEILNGQTYYRFRDDDAAVEALTKAIKLNPAYADAYCELAHAYNLLNRYEEAAAAYSVEATLRRENETQQGEISSTVLEYQKQHEVRDAFVVAQIYTKLGNDDKALTSLQRAARISPEDDNIHYWIGKTFLSLGDIQSAKREQELLTELCKSKNKFFITQCQASAQDLLDAIEKRSR